MNSIRIPHEQDPAWLNAVSDLASELGFLRMAIAPAVDSRGYSDLVRWIESGFAAGMDYFADRLDAYQHPSGVMAGVKSILVFVFPYPAHETASVNSGSGRVARYAWPGDDYHDVVHQKLKALKRKAWEVSPSLMIRGCIDTAPLMERELAVLAGLGWQGKNTLLLNRELGSYFFLATLLVDAELPYDQPHTSSHCGTCTACLDACPTDAFDSAGVLDASRCISYLTIEHRDAIPVELRDGIGDWIFGCDVCQEVCPWNRKPSRAAGHPDQDFPLREISLTEWFELDEDDFRRRFKKTPLWRTRLRGMKRNAAIVLGNTADESVIPVLRSGAEDSDEVVAESCRWAIEKILARQQ